MHNAAYDALGLNWVYVPLPVRDTPSLLKFTEAVRGLPFVGFNVTMPYKQTMLELCDDVALFAQMAGAVNTVHVVEGRLIGYNTDGRGLIEALKEEVGYDASGARVALIGAGGAAGAALVAFVLARAAHVSVLNRDVGRAETLIDRLEAHRRGTELRALPLGPEARDAISSADLVVNATPVGLVRDDPSPIPVEWLHDGQVVCDMIYQQSTTALLDGAARVGAKCLGGLSMLVAQGALAIDIWSDSAQTAAPRAVMREAAEEAFREMQGEGITQ